MKKILIITAILLIMASSSVAAGLYSFLKEVEEDNKVKLNAYLDSGGVWTIGYGSVYNYDLNRPVQKGDVITKEQAERYLKKEADSKLNTVTKYVKVPLNKFQQIALASFAYNVGNNAFINSTLLKVINAKGNKEDITFQFMRWVYDNGVRVQGLVNRRKAEVAIYFK